MASFNKHQYPHIFLRYPFLLRLSHSVEFIITLRLWYIRKFTLKSINKLNSPFKMLDAGCGSGALLITLAGRFGKGDYHGIDKSDSSIATANSYAKYKKLSNLNFEPGSIENFNSQEIYDIAGLYSVLIYIEDDIAALRNLYNSLRTGGKLLLFVSINHKRALPFFDRIISQYFRHEDYNLYNRVYHRYTSRSIIEKVHTAGFKTITKTETVGNFGRLAYELYTILFYLTVKFSFPLNILPGIVFLIYIPLHIILMLLDYLSEIESGNSCFIIAEK